MNAKLMIAIPKKIILLYLLLSVIVAIGGYLAIKPFSKLVLIDVLNLDSSFNLSKFEWIAFTGFVTSVTLFFFVILVIYRLKKITPAYEILNEIKPSLYEPDDYKKVKDYYESYIKKERTQAPKSFQDIPKYYPKSVYALTGGWRSGKTSAAGMLLDIMRKDKSLNVKSETYHDSFNFANMDESISTFFNALAIKTKIPEFKNLGKVSSHGLDMGFNIGPLSIKKVFSEELWANETRKIIFEKLHASRETHVVVLDDIDRLLPAEQYQWLKVIELLGRFQQKLVIIVPVHIYEVTENLKELKLNPRYIDKIIPKKNRLPIGVNINYIKSIMGISGKSNQRAKRIYAKYLISLAIRESLSVLVTNKIATRGEWYNEIATGGISEIANGFAESVSRRHPVDGTLNVGKVTINRGEQIWFRRNDNTYGNQNIISILANRFLPGSYQMSNDIPEGTYQQLRRLEFLADIFGTHEFAAGPDTGYERKPSQFEPREWHDLWIEVIWPIVRTIKSDKNLSSHFTYSNINEEIYELMKTNSEQDERAILIGLVLRWDYT